MLAFSLYFPPLFFSILVLTYLSIVCPPQGDLDRYLHSETSQKLDDHMMLYLAFSIAKVINLLSFLLEVNLFVTLISSSGDERNP